MATRKIKDAYDIDSNELIYFKGHAKATYMSDGTNVEDAINAKQGSIADLETIRSGAEKGTTALQSIPSEYVTKTDLKDYYSKDNVSSIPFVSYESQALTDAQKEQARKNIGADGMPMVEHGTADTTFALTPNIFHVWGAVASLSLTLGSEKSGVVNEFLFQFESGATATTLSLPSSIKWTKELEIEPNKIYQISILKGLASVLSWEA